MTNFQAVGTYLVVKIDKKKQKEKPIFGKLAKIYIPPAHEYMKYRLQYAEIMSVGEKVTNPECIVGRTAILHHIVESEDKYLIATLPDGDELRKVNTTSFSNSNQFYGIIMEDGSIVADEPFVFCLPPTKEDEKIEEFDFNGQKVAYNMSKGSTAPGSLIIQPKLHKSKEEMRQYTYTTRVAFVSSTETVLHPGDKVLIEDFMKYPINLFDKDYLLIRREYIVAVGEDVVSS